MIAAFVFGIALAWSQAAARNSQPRVSATDTAYLSCTVWTGKDWSSPGERSARTPIAQSKDGARAYGEVKVVANKEDCSNTTTLYASSASSQEFKTTYTTRGNGNGIRLIGWSPGGNKLLAEVNFWKYETDRGFGHVPLIYDIATRQATEIEAVGKALDRYFGNDCEFELSVKGWKSDAQLAILVSPTPTDESYDQHFCVKEPRLFVFDLSKGNVRPEDAE